VTSAVVVVDREQGGNYSLSEKGVTLHSLCTLSQVRQIPYLRVYKPHLDF
jgi:orotate phosphoribosyltransferase